VISAEAAAALREGVMGNAPKLEGHCGRRLADCGRLGTTDSIENIGWPVGSLLQSLRADWHNEQVIFLLLQIRLVFI
jgi:hypothetical protein